MLLLATAQTTSTDLRTINLRQNLLTDVACWSESASKGVIEDVEFRDNQIKDVSSRCLPRGCFPVRRVKGWAQGRGIAHHVLHIRMCITL